MFINPINFSFVQALQSNWRMIQQELLALPTARFEPWKETFLYDTGWDVFGLYGFGKKQPDNCDLAPKTTALVETIPGMVTSAFSCLKPKTHIKPHTGYHYEFDADGKLVRSELNNKVLRLHLGLIVPETYTDLGCAIRVGRYIQNWREGECLIFDDTQQHEAWNRSTGLRVVLLIDFIPVQPITSFSVLD